MKEARHMKQRVRQRGIIKRMVGLTLDFDEVGADKIYPGFRKIKKLLHNRKHISPVPKHDLFIILDKGGPVVVAADDALVTAYNRNRR